MNSNKTTEQMSNTSIQKAAKIAGFMFLISLIIPLFNWTFLLSNLIVPENLLDTANNIIDNMLLFRIGITVELFMSIGLLILALTLYRILKSENKSLALLALSLKLVEATIVAVTVLVSFIALLILNGDLHLTGYTSEQLKAPIGFLLNEHTTIYSIPMVFLGLDMTIFCYLLFISRYIPRLLAGFGILSFILIFIHALMYVIAPQIAAMPVSQLIFWVPSGLFEIIIGLWFLIKGIKIKPGNSITEKISN